MTDPSVSRQVFQVLSPLLCALTHAHHLGLAGEIAVSVGRTGLPPGRKLSPIKTRRHGSSGPRSGGDATAGASGDAPRRADCDRLLAAMKAGRDELGSAWPCPLSKRPKMRRDRPRRDFLVIFKSKRSSSARGPACGAPFDRGPITGRNLTGPICDLTEGPSQAQNLTYYPPLRAAGP